MLTHPLPEEGGYSPMTRVLYSEPGAHYTGKPYLVPPP